MTFLLDTNACVTFLRHKNSNVATRLAQYSADKVVICSVVRAELYFGAFRSQQTQRNLATVREFLASFQSLPFDDKAAEIYGKLRCDLTNAGTLIGPNDMLIASIALASGATLVTHNTSEFSRVSELTIEDWER